MIGPRILACGTPERTGSIFDSQLFADASCCWLVRYAQNHFQRFSEMP